MIAGKTTEPTACVGDECHIYIGLHRNGKGDFEWPDGTPFGPGSFANWEPGEPDDDNASGACVEMSQDGKWNDTACDERRLHICEKPVCSVSAAAPPPATAA